MSSKDPNLQNIPRKGEDGLRIRRCFIAPPGHKLVAADDSQIELRILAHIAPIPEMLAAFAAGEDIHAATASGMFKVPIKDMPPATRDRAKAINFGIIYGMSHGGLAKQLNITDGEALKLLFQYHKQYPGILLYIDKVKKNTHSTGYITTILGRKCHYPDIRSKDDGKRSHAERQCVNMTIQGSAADIISLAMIRRFAVVHIGGPSSNLAAPLNHNRFIRFNSFRTDTEGFEKVMYSSSTVEEVKLPSYRPDYPDPRACKGKYQAIQSDFVTSKKCFLQRSDTAVSR